MDSRQLIERLPEAVREQMDLWLRSPARTGEGEEPAAFSDQERVRERFAGLSPLEKKTLELVVKRLGTTPFDGNRLGRENGASMAGAEIEAGLILLRQKGWLFTFRKSWGERLYVMATDTFAHLQPLVTSAVINMETAIEPEAVQGRGWVWDLFHSLVYIAKNELKLTQKGTPNKRQLQKLAEIVSLAEEDLSGIFSYAHGDVYEPRTALVLDCLLRLELLKKSEGAFVVDPARLAEWLQLREEEMEAALYGLWKEQQFPEDIRQQHLAVLLERLPRGEWVAIGGVQTWLDENGVSACRKDAEAEAEGWMSCLLRPLLCFGWLQTGMSGDGRRWLRRLFHTKEEALLAEEMNERFLVQPDFEIMVPHGVPFTDRWELEAAAQHLRSDGVSLYRITKESFLFACENGRTAKGILIFLGSRSLYGLPDNVVSTLRGWGEQHGKTQLQEAVLLRCQDRETADAVERMESAAPLLLERLGEKDFIVNAAQKEELEKLLYHSGLSPKKMDKSSAGSAMLYPFLEDTPDGIYDLQQMARIRLNKVLSGLHEAAQGIINSRTPALYYEMDSAPACLQEWKRRFTEIPANWMKDYRSYHLSTRKEIAEAALRLKTYLQVKRHGSDIRIIPLKIVEQAGGWSILVIKEGKEETISARDWDEMKLVMPAIVEK